MDIIPDDDAAGLNTLTESLGGDLESS